MSTVAIVPARGGSKGVPRKNLRPLAGLPLVLHTVAHARDASSVDEVVVTTDDAEIARLVEGAGATVVMRPAELAGDTSPTLPALTHALECLGTLRPAWGAAPPEKVVTLQPTSPLRSPEHINRAVALLTEEYDSVVSVCEAEHTPYKMFREEEGLLHPLIPGTRPGVPRQQLPVAYRENGAVYVTWRRVLLEERSIWGCRARPLVMDHESSIDIDSEMDLHMAELMLDARARRGGR